MTSLQLWLALLLWGLGALQPALAAQAFVSLGGPGGSVSQFRPFGGPALRSFATPPGAVDLLLSADGQRLIVGTTHLRQADVQGGAPSRVAVLDASTGALLAEYPMPGSVVKMVWNAAETRLYASGLRNDDGAGLVMSLDLQTGQTTSALVPGASPYSLYSIAIAPDGHTVFVPVTHGIAVFDATSLGSLGSIDLPSNGIVAPPAVTLDGATLLAAGGGSVMAIDLASRTLLKKFAITSSAAAFGAVLSPDGQTYWVSAGTLNAIDVASLTVRGTVALGQNNPFRLAISADGRTLFATDLTFGTTAVVDAASLRSTATLRSLAPPYAVVVRANGQPLILNENSNALVRVDTQTVAASLRFPVGDAPGAAVSMAGKLFVPEVANMAVQASPLAPEAVKLIDTGFIQTSGAVGLGDKVYANSGSSVRVIDPVRERVTRSLVLRTGGGGIGSALKLAAAGDGRSLLASYLVLAIDGGPVGAGIIRLDTVTGAQRLLSSLPFVPGNIAASGDGLTAYGVGLLQTDEVGRWDLATQRFSASRLQPGNPVYVDLAVSRDGRQLLLVDEKGKVDFVDAASLQLITSVAVGTKPSAVAISVDGLSAVVTDSVSTSVTLLDLPNRRVAGAVPVGAPSSGAVFID